MKLTDSTVSTDDFAGWLALQTNLALKGVIGIKAMSEIAEVVGNKEDAKYYRVTSVPAFKALYHADSLEEHL